MVDRLLVKEIYILGADRIPITHRRAGGTGSGTGLEAVCNGADGGVYEYGNPGGAEIFF